MELCRALRALSEELRCRPHHDESHYLSGEECREPACHVWQRWNRMVVYLFKYVSVSNLVCFCLSQMRNVKGLVLTCWDAPCADSAYTLRLHLMRYWLLSKAAFMFFWYVVVYYVILCILLSFKNRAVEAGLWSNRERDRATVGGGIESQPFRTSASFISLFSQVAKRSSRIINQCLRPTIFWEHIPGINK